MTMQRLQYLQLQNRPCLCPLCSPWARLCRRGSCHQRRFHQLMQQQPPPLLLLRLLLPILWLHRLQPQSRCEQTQTQLLWQPLQLQRRAGYPDGQPQRRRHQLPPEQAAPPAPRAPQRSVQRATVRGKAAAT